MDQSLLLELLQRIGELDIQNARLMRELSAMKAEKAKPAEVSNGTSD